MLRRRALLAASIAAPAATLLTNTVASAAPVAGVRSMPWEFALPNGFRPEGIAVGPGPFAYLASLVDGCVFRYDLRTGNGRMINPGGGTPSVGMKTDGYNRLFVAGGSGGNGCVLDASTGHEFTAFRFATGDTYVNDVVLTDDAAWFTDSCHPELYGLPLRGGELPTEFVRLPLTGDFVMGDGINANGIARTPDGRALLVMQTNTGRLFHIDPRTGAARAVDLNGELLSHGDGLLLDRHRLLVVQNRLNRIAVVHLNSRGTAGRVVDHITDQRFDVPTAVAALGDRLYLPNARLTTPPSADTTYNVVAVRRR
ncbi:superoxide dismutase [Actinophytocola sp.]|uniref:superoxide dismutase n=1 Tax=Actinophytocola sp. TaxID=1872138 RepID=UPI003D6BD91C